MIKEFEPPFLYRTPKPIEDKIRASSANLFESKIRFILLFFSFNGFFIKELLDKKDCCTVFRETMMIFPVFFVLFFCSYKVSIKINFNSYRKLSPVDTNINKANTSIIVDFFKTIGAILANTWRIIIFDNLLYTLTALIEIFLFYKLSKRINWIIFTMVLGNILIFYAPIYNRCPKFLFRIRMFIKEIIEGVLVVLSCLIPFGSKSS